MIGAICGQTSLAAFARAAAFAAAAFAAAFFGQIPLFLREPSQPKRFGAARYSESEKVKAGDES